MAEQLRASFHLIMCGGAGTRLWPASREGRPKQFLPLFGTLSTFQETLCACPDPAVFGRPIVITNAQYRFIVAEQLAESKIEADILLEPARRDSGPAIAAGAAFALQRDSDPVVVALAADHVVTDTAGFVAACRSAAEAAARRQASSPSACEPDRPATEYGYIRPGRSDWRATCSRSSSFVEKPDAKTAESYIAQGYLWNSGNFVFARRRSCSTNIAPSTRKPSPPRKPRSTRPASISALSRSITRCLRVGQCQLRSTMR